MAIYTCNGRTPQIPASAFVAREAVLVGSVVLGDEASVWFNAVLRGDINSIVIGDRTNVQDGSIFHVTAHSGVHVGNDVTIGHRAIVHGCTIGDGSLVGMGAVILDNARIGPGALVAAGAVVLENAVIPESSLAAGVPARVIRPLTEKEKRKILESARNYVGYAQSFRT